MPVLNSSTDVLVNVITHLQAEMKIEGLKVGTATLATENMLNIKLHSSEEISNVRNINFLIPSEADAKEVSIEIVNDTILMRVPVRKKHI